MGGQTDAAYSYLKQKILDGTYRPSQKLNESELSEALGVSRNTLKKAFLKLEQEKLVSIEENKGASVKDFTLEEVLNYLEIRIALESLVTKSAAENMGNFDLDSLWAVLERMAEFLKENRFDEYSNLNKEFHDIIYRASKNQQAVEIIRTIKTQLTRFHFKTILVPERQQRSYKEHREIFESLKAHDGIRAEKAIREHVGNIRRTIEENYSYFV